MLEWRRGWIEAETLFQCTVWLDLQGALAGAIVQCWG